MATYTPLGALHRLVQSDPGEVDQGAEYAYDAAARLVGHRTGGFTFAYAYDALQNQVARTYEGPRPLDMLAGEATYGAPGGTHPRQLAELAGTRFRYDAAGRLASVGARQLRFDAADRLVQVTEPGGLVVQHQYGFDGERVRTDSPAGTERLFSSSHSRRGDTTTFIVPLANAHSVQLKRDAACGEHRAASECSSVTYLHAGVGTWVGLSTDQSGSVVSEQLYEAFGTPLSQDAAPHALSAARKPLDANTGYADHGARWMARSFALWLAPDAPAKLPDAAFMRQPWDLHPYQFLRHNPALFEDPDGNVAILAATAGMAATGVLLGGGAEAFMQWQAGTGMAADRIGLYAAGGAVGGVASGLVGGAVVGAAAHAGVVAGVGVAAVAAGTAGVAGGVTTRAVLGEVSTLSMAALDAALDIGTLGHGRAIKQMVPILRNSRIAVPEKLKQTLHHMFDKAKYNLSEPTKVIGGRLATYNRLREAGQKHVTGANVQSHVYEKKAELKVELEGWKFKLTGHVKNSGHFDMSNAYISGTGKP